MEQPESLEQQMQQKTKRFLTIGALAISLILAIIALITFLKLRSLEQETEPVKKEAKEPETFQQDEAYQAPCRFSFTIQPSPSPSPSPDTSPSPSPSPTPSPPPSPSPSPGTSPSPSPSPSPTYYCWDQCNYNYQCPEDLECLEVNGFNRCLNPNCRQEQNCICPPLASPSPSPSPQITPTSPSPISMVSQPSPSPIVPSELPRAGTFSPTLLFAIGGLVLIFLGLLL